MRLMDVLEQRRREKEQKDPPETCGGYYVCPRSRRCDSLHNPSGCPEGCWAPPKPPGTEFKVVADARMRLQEASRNIVDINEAISTLNWLIPNLKIVAADEFDGRKRRLVDSRLELVRNPNPKTRPDPHQSSGPSGSTQSIVEESQLALQGLIERFKIENKKKSSAAWVIKQSEEYLKLKQELLDEIEAGPYAIFYELVDANGCRMADIAEDIGPEIQQDWHNFFSEMHRLYPADFRQVERAWSRSPRIYLDQIPFRAYLPKPFVASEPLTELPKEGKNEDQGLNLSNETNEEPGSDKGSRTRHDPKVSAGN